MDNSTIKYYLPKDIDDNKPVFLTAKLAYQLTHGQPIDKLIKGSCNWHNKANY
jgi:hypothetical protein